MGLVDDRATEQKKGSDKDIDGRIYFLGEVGPRHANVGR
jgi:hypothetical protein